MNNTPETNLLVDNQHHDCVPYDDAAGQLADLARKLERERDEARGALKRITECDMRWSKKIARDALEGAK